MVSTQVTPLDYYRLLSVRPRPGDRFAIARPTGECAEASEDRVDERRDRRALEEHDQGS